ncbi:MAG TPA: SGNH/GDSL hydrolase family protein [Myxococcota bacterium]|nr:SGNH/GDSL hydrolase family protein [Myxococcota bacterium]
MRHAWRALGALCGAAWGLSLWWALSGAMGQADPSSWDERESSVPIETAWMAGPLAERPGTVDLWFYRALSPVGLRFDEGDIRVRARVPDGGQLRVQFGVDLEAAGPQAPAGPRPGGPPPGPAGARGPGAAPGGDSGGGPPPVFGQKPGLSIQNLQEGASVLVDRTRGTYLGLNGLSCTSDVAPPEELDLVLRVREGGVELLESGQAVGRCTGGHDAGPLVLSGGIRRIQLRSVEIEGWGGGSFAAGLRSGWLALPLALLFAALGGLLGRDRRALALLPLCAGPLLFALDMRVVLDRMRLLEVASLTGPLLLSTLPAALAALIAWARGPLWRTGALCAGLAALLVCVPWIGSRAGLVDWLAVGLPLLPWAGLAWVNKNPFPRRVLASYGLLALVLVCGEIAIRTSALSRGWTVSEGWQRAGLEFQELMELRQYRRYPSDGFPVRPPPPSDTPRIVALGGSSTGGAFQMDDIELFWPAELEQRLEGWEVVNQGVGGWNTLHVRLYAESQMETLEPDILAVYVAHNDLLTESAVPYSTLYARYRPGQDLGTPLMERSSLYFGFKTTVLALARRDTGVAVPVDDARDNLRAVLASAEGVGARVLLMTEGLNPDPGPLAEYAEMQRELAEEHGGLFFDAAAYLHEQEDPNIFLDDCHLSRRGHQVLASEIARVLEQEGWLTPQ